MRLYIFLFALWLSWPIAASAATLVDSNNKNTELGPIQLASTYTNHLDVRNYLASEKLDGIRARWTGQALYTRNGNRIYAPKWFTQNWPSAPLDGELWTVRGEFSEIASIVLNHHPDERWRHVKMMLFDLPVTDVPFFVRVDTLKTLVAHTANPSLQMVTQFPLASLGDLNQRLTQLSSLGAEGIMLHHKLATYRDGRSNSLLKVKQHDDAEAKVIAHIKGKGKFSDVMGALLVETHEGLQFKIGSGFTLQERASPPPLGSWITFKYYGLTKHGIPRFATYLRIRPEQDRAK